MDEESLHWDWLIEGKEPMRRRNATAEPCRPLDRHGVNQRLLSLFPDMPEAKLAALFDVHQTAIHKWRHDRAFVSWSALEFAVTEKKAT